MGSQSPTAPVVQMLGGGEDVNLRALMDPTRRWNLPPNFLLTSCEQIQCDQKAVGRQGTSQ